MNRHTSLRIDRHSPDECEAEGCHERPTREKYIGREAHRVDVCEWHALLIEQGAEVIGA